MSRQNRRTFLKQSAVATAAVAMPMVASSRVLGANDAIQLAVAGINGRGGSHISEFAKMDGVQVSWLVDPDSRLFASRTKAVERLGKNTPQCVQDVRKALEDKKLDAVSIATPNHWHSLVAIWACQAGKDVYVEKPCSHNVYEGRKLVEAARKYNRIVQHGTQSRSSASWAKAVAAVKQREVRQAAGLEGYASKASGRGASVSRKPRSRPRSSTSTSGSARRRSSPTTRTSCTTTGTGSGISATARSATRACTRWTSPAGRFPMPMLPKSVIAFGGRLGRQAELQRPGPDAEHATGRLGLRRPALGVRGARVGRQAGTDGKKFRAASTTSSTWKRA